MRKSLIVASLCLGLSVPLTAHALMIPQVDLARFQQLIVEEIKRTGEWLAKGEVERAKIEAEGVATEMEVDNNNNAIANWIARNGKAIQDIFNIEQMSRSEPTRNACSAVAVSKSISSTECEQTDVFNQVNEMTGIGGAVASSPGSVASTFQYGFNSPHIASSGEKKESNEPIETNEERALREHRERQAHWLGRIDKWDAEGKSVEASDSTLLLVSDSDNLQYDYEQLEMAAAQAIMTYRPYLRTERHEMTQAMEKAQHVRRQNAINGLNMNIVNQMSMRVAPTKEVPSKLMAMTLPVKVVMDQDGTFSTDGQSWMQRMVQDEGTQPTEIDRESLFLKTVALQQKLESYKSSLLHEKILLTRLQHKIDP